MNNSQGNKEKERRIRRNDNRKCIAKNCKKNENREEKKLILENLMCLFMDLFVSVFRYVCGCGKLKRKELCQ